MVKFKEIRAPVHAAAPPDPDAHLSARKANSSEK